jgi:hypothetical protein
MVSTLPASQVTLADLEKRYGLSLTTQEDFFTEWRVNLPSLTELEEQSLDRVKANFTSLLKTPPLLENSVKMVMLSPLLDLAGFYQTPFRIVSEPSIEVMAVDNDEIIRGRIDVLVLQGRLWVLVLESKRSDFAVSIALPQALACMLGNPDSTCPTYGLISNGNEFLFLKATPSPQARYAHSRLFSLLNPGNELYAVLQVLKSLGQAIGGDR